MQLQSTSLNILQQLTNMVNQLSDEEYSAPLDLLSGNTIGKHLRHVVEFFDLLAKSYGPEMISYDDRKHDQQLEEDRGVAKEKLEELKAFIQSDKKDKTMVLRAGYTTTENEAVDIRTSFYRELAYNIEHAIHHMAIMKIAIQTVFPRISLDENFGIAYSTIRYQKHK